MKKIKVLVSGGGTAGHINPALAIIREIERRYPDCEILYVGTREGLEAKLVKDAGYKMEYVRVSGFRRKISFDTIKSAVRLVQGMADSKKVVKSFKPDIAIGTGGYVCGPVLKCAAKRGVHTLIHEQNAFPGVTNKLLSKQADVVAISFDDARQHFPNAKRVELTGNPVRSELLNVKHVESASGKKKVVCMGGSRGAERINDAMIDLINNNYNGEYELLYATGEVHYDNVMARIKHPLPEGVDVVPYIYNSASAFASADLMVCRSGAITVAELAVTGVPSVLIPSPYVTANHQMYNAKTLERVGGAKIIPEDELNAEKLNAELISILKDDSQLEQIRSNALKAGIPDAAKRIGDLVEELMK